MNRIYSVASGILGTLGVTLLLISLLLVPQSRAIAQTLTGPKVCGGMSCDLPPCVAYYELNGNCPNRCTKVVGTQFYCKCISDAVNCDDCVCIYNSAGNYCSCLLPPI